MKMFVWDSGVLQDYRDGLLCVIAETLEEAKEAVRLEAAKYPIRHGDARWADECSHAAYALLQAIEKSPDRIEDGPAVAWIWGSS